MATFTAGTSFTDGVTGDVTAAKLNALVANATPLHNLITDRTAETAVASDDLVLISDTSDSGALNKATCENLFRSTGTGTAAAPAVAPSSDTNTGIFFPAADTIALAEGGTEAMRIDSSGNVGIGTASPGARLHIQTTGGETLRLERSGTAGQISSLSLIDGGGTSCRITSTSGVLTFDTNGATERLRIDSSGNVGIGVSSMTQKLHVAGSGVLAGTLFIGDGSSSVIRKLNSSTPLNFANSSGASEMTIGSSGNVGIGSASPVNKLEVVGSFGRGAPVTKTADFTLADTENWVIVNKGSSPCTVTLPAASSWTGREVTIKVITAHTVVSASSNVVPRVGGSAGTSILLGTDGAWATLVSDGTNWIIMCGS
jgi:hypothetical protein